MAFHVRDIVKIIYFNHTLISLKKEKLLYQRNTCSHFIFCPFNPHLQYAMYLNGNTTILCEF